MADRIDARVTELAAAGLDDKAIFEAMAVNHMPAIKRLLADDNLQDLCSRRPKPQPVSRHRRGHDAQIQTS